jgi:hypothetical protein
MSFIALLEQIYLETYRSYKTLLTLQTVANKNIYYVKFLENVLYTCIYLTAYPYRHYVMYCN